MRNLNQSRKALVKLIFRFYKTRYQDELEWSGHFPFDAECLKNANGIIYLIQMQEVPHLVKIGWTGNEDTLAERLQYVSRPVDCAVIATICDVLKLLETLIHLRLNQFRIPVSSPLWPNIGIEWFAPNVFVFREMLRWGAVTPYEAPIPIIYSSSPSEWKIPCKPNYLQKQLDRYTEQYEYGEISREVYWQLYAEIKDRF